MAFASCSDIADLQMQIDAIGIPDGSETKVQAGANTTVTGAGTASNPYIISSASATPDGSETKVTAGTNATVTGTGTTADPYVINSTSATPDGSETKVTAGTNVTVSGSGTTASPYVVSSPVQNLSQSGDQLSISSGNSLTLQPVLGNDGTSVLYFSFGV